MGSYGSGSEHERTSSEKSWVSTASGNSRCNLLPHIATCRHTSVGCIMPNHLHWILTPQRKRGMTKIDSRIIPILQRFKSYTAHSANRVLQRTGSFWAREYYDHRIRDSEEFDRLVGYTLENPVKAKLCKNWNEWTSTTCSESIKEAFSHWIR